MTDRYAVIGNPIGHSKSPDIHQAFATQFSEDMVYDAIEAPLGGFAEIARRFFEGGGLGLNVTVPFKVDAHDFADDRQQAAQICGASNCLKIEDGRVIAENFDGIGLLRDVSENLGVDVRGARVLMIGAGGAARGSVVPFLQAGAGKMVIANRTFTKAQSLAEDLAQFGPVTACQISDISGGFDIVLNSTSASLEARPLPLPPQVFEGSMLAYDLVYGKGQTPFLTAAKTSGAAHIADGVGMLVEQAAEAFAWWRGKRPDTAPVIESLTVPLK